MENNNYLALARQARSENNSEDAKLYYGKVREQCPEDGEAKFFYAFYSLYEGKNGEIPGRFAHLCQVLLTSIEMIKKSDILLEKQHEILSLIATAFIPETWSLNKYMNHKNHETKIGDSYVKVFKSVDIVSCCKKGMFALRDFGDSIEKLYGSDANFKSLAVLAWKEYVSLAQKWHAYPPKGEAEIYAAKIKTVDPLYEMPKKAGCISLADKKK